MNAKDLAQYSFKDLLQMLREEMGRCEMGRSDAKLRDQLFAECDKRKAAGEKP